MFGARRPANPGNVAGFSVTRRDERRVAANAQPAWFDRWLLKKIRHLVLIHTLTERDRRRCFA